MIYRKEVKNLNGFNNGKHVVSQLIVPYNIASLNRYKRIDELVLSDGKSIKATLAPVNLDILPYDGLLDYVVTQADENRLDIIAYKMYGKAALYWVIAYFNKLSDPLNVPEGTLLQIPLLQSLSKYPNPLY